jgi:hypothetical protein
MMLSSFHPPSSLFDDYKGFFLVRINFLFVISSAKPTSCQTCAYTYNTLKYKKKEASGFGRLLTNGGQIKRNFILFGQDTANENGIKKGLETLSRSERPNMIDLIGFNMIPQLYIIIVHVKQVDPVLILFNGMKKGSTMPEVV